MKLPFFITLTDPVFRIQYKNRIIIETTIEIKRNSNICLIQSETTFLFQHDISPFTDNRTEMQILLHFLKPETEIHMTINFT